MLGVVWVKALGLGQRDRCTLERHKLCHRVAARLHDGRAGGAHVLGEVRVGVLSTHTSVD